MLKRDNPCVCPLWIWFSFSPSSPTCEFIKERFLLLHLYSLEEIEHLKKLPRNMQDIFGDLVTYFQSVFGLINSTENNCDVLTTNSHAAECVVSLLAAYLLPWVSVYILCWRFIHLAHSWNYEIIRKKYVRVVCLERRCSRSEYLTRQGQ